MKIKNILSKYKIIGLLLFSILISGSISAQKKGAKKGKALEINVNLTVTDESGKVVPKAQVVLGEGILHEQTDENGKYAFKGHAGDFVTVSSDGYEKSVFLLETLLSDNTVKLVKSKLYMSSEDLVELPFNTIKKRELTGSQVALHLPQIDKYPTIGINLQGLVAGLDDDMSARGTGLIYMLDNVPTSYLPDVNEIESVTIVKDIVGKAMYGPGAANGIVFIKTKRGKQNERVLNVNMEAGTSMAGRMPNWVNGADYAKLNNQARLNDGLSANYTESDIAAYSKGDPYDYYHPSIGFREMMLKNSKPFRKANISSSGGNDKVQYFAYLGYGGEGDLLQIGPTSNYNQLNARSNIDIKINDYIKVQFDFSGDLSYRKGTSALDFVSVMNGITTTPPVAFPIYAAPYDPLSGNAPFYAVSSNYELNPIAELISTGYSTESGRNGTSNASVDFDLKNILKGLKFKSFIGFNAFYQQRIGKANQYYAYIATPDQTSDGRDTILLSKVRTGTQVTSESQLSSAYYQRLSAYESLSYDKSFGKSDLQTSLTYFTSKFARNGVKEPQRTQDGILTGKYSYDNKYIFNGTLNYGGSSSFAVGKRFNLSPSAGLAWVISEESFLKNIKCVNYLKLRAEGGILGVENFIDPFMYRDNWNSGGGTNFGPYGANQWFGNQTENDVYITYPNRTGNPDIGWEKRREFSAGIDGLFLNQKLSLDLTYYNTLRDGIITRPVSNIPYIVGVSDAIPLINFNKVRYTGVEMGIQYTDKINSFKYSVGGNATVQNSKNERLDEPQYRNAYQFHQGVAADTYFGLTNIGKFKDDAEALVVPQIYDQVLKTGDLKYKDINGDGIIDDSDYSPIGHTTPRLFYAVNLKLSYRGFEFYAIGTGRAFYDIPLTNSYFQNGWGDNNYSEFVKNNIGGAYPRLTYNKVNNNFVSSTFWLVKGGFFKIRNVELAYNLPANSLKIIGVRGTRLFVRGSNLLTLSKIKDVDPENIDSGIEGYPIFSTYTAGLKLTF